VVAGIGVAVGGVIVATGVVETGVGVGVGVDVENWALQTGPLVILVHGTLGMVNLWFGKMRLGHQRPFSFAIAHGETL
jgi:hypothetical protein